MFDNRLTVESPGTLPGIVRLNNMRHVHFSRNPKIAQFLHEYEYVQEFGEGVDRLYEVMESEGLPQPEYRTQAFMLSATIRNTKSYGNLWATPQATSQATPQATSQATPQATPQAEQILTFCVTARTRNEIAEHFGVKDPKFFAKKHIKPLLESGALRMTIPNKPTSPAQKYVTVERHG